MLSSWRSPFKLVTSRTQNIVLKSEALILTLNNSANSLSLLSCHSSSNSVSISVYYQACCLSFLSKYQSVSLGSKVCMILEFPSHAFAYLLISGHLLWTPDNSNFFQFPYKVGQSRVTCNVITTSFLGYRLACVTCSYVTCSYAVDWIHAELYVHVIRTQFSKRFCLKSGILHRSRTDFKQV